MTADFDKLVDLEGLSPAEQARLLRVHDLLVAAGPPAELPSALASPPAELEPAKNNVVAFPRRRRAAAALLIAATVSAACFGGGYLLANQTHKSAIHTVRIVKFTGQQNTFASLRVGSADPNGNWPVQLAVTGLKPLKGRGAHYILMVVYHGKPAAICGMFQVGAKGQTTVTFSVPYKITNATTWAVTEMTPGAQFPGHVVMTTS